MLLSELRVGDRYKIVVGVTESVVTIVDIRPPLLSFRCPYSEPLYEGAGWRIVVITDAGERKRMTGTKKFVERLGKPRRMSMLYEGVSYVCPYCVEEVDDPSHAWWCLTRMTERDEEEQRKVVNIG